MLILHVFMHIKDEYVKKFRIASLENVEKSLEEPEVANFEIIQQKDDSTKFLFMERYYTEEGQLKHRETEHFKKWKEETKDMFAEPYTFIKYKDVNWKTERIHSVLKQLKI